MKMTWQEELEKIKKRRIVLALDTAVTGCSVCISDGDHFWTEIVETERGQAECLVPMINRVIRKAGYTYNDFDRIAVTTGPGSFTGVRVGLSTAKALGLSINRPVLGFDTLSVIAKASGLQRDTVILIDTKRGDFYGQAFTADLQPIGDPEIWTLGMAESSAFAIIRDVQPDVEVMARMAIEDQTDEIHYNPEKAPHPLYIRGAEVSQSKRAVPKIVKSA
ncbi:MAG: tRNA (adenosine(37)-N6)-threonylcarbamoyltransferase complex dimerization subunit type 1 TsaB [Micavibrio aeruginosavorus]|uniref:tRNA (Adenosine(37)-N6)-threonylcarbamoyltransferase complex dimerization subunit type 1 TsaB n=1 Tax=Micavibrio aeruginosavorus TaxID=349221 RepID=A0A2W5H5P6_9BACT|nr:MAG: tRNA (adenosine(37)-N6)-threonylcarbamoyltransferase complex dimerization subunit type 1 TsaB [Micavibrio aeruginosavorus]